MNPKDECISVASRHLISPKHVSDFSEPEGVTS